MGWIMMGLEEIMEIFIKLFDFQFITTIDTIGHIEMHNRPMCPSIVLYCAYCG